jgi:hypothetical protein
MAALTVAVTYETVTPESAEQGDFADVGFLDSHGFRNYAAALWGAEAGALKARCSLTLRDALTLFGERYGPHGVESDYPTFRQADGSQDYRTGEETRLALHLPRSASAATFARVRRIVEGV